jgi:hypothetical protein
MVTLARCLVLALTSWLLCACSGKSPRTELILVADTDIPGLERIRFDISSGDRSESAETTMFDAGPASVGVVQESEDEAALTVTASGYLPGLREAAVERTAVVMFVARETRVVELHLLARCLNVSCVGDRTCTEQGCASPELSSDDLPPWTGTTPTLDASARPQNDGGSDAGLDAGGDAGSDAGAAQDASQLVDCGANAHNIDLQTNVEHCGMCKNACKATAKNTVPLCRMAQCEVDCRLLYGDCDDDSTNGCEQALWDDSHCGGCGMVCMNNTSCTRLGLCR